MSEPVMHYQQAAHIGAFGEASSDPALRRRRVWVARRDAPKVFCTAAEHVGKDKRHPDLYQGSDANLDVLWQRAERGYTAVAQAVAQIRATETIDTVAFVNVVGPWCAHLLARHPRLAIDGQESLLTLDLPERDAGLKARRDLFPQLCDSLLTQRRWLLVTSAEPLVTTDLGWQWMPGSGTGELFIPITQDAAFVIRDDGRTYQPSTATLDIPVITWDQEWVTLRRDLMILTSPKDVYASTQQAAESAFELWQQPAPEPPDLEGLTEEEVQAIPLTPHDLSNIASSAFVEMFVHGGATDPSVAFGRMLALQHQFGCECAEALAAIEDEEVRALIAQHTHEVLTVAEESLQAEGLLPPSDSESTV